MVKSDEHAEFCQRVKARRLELGLTQIAVADRLGVTQSTWANIEAGRNEPGLKLIYRVAEALETNVAELLPLHARHG